MNKIGASVLGSLLYIISTASGCATVAPISLQEKCARDGMVLAGASAYEGSSAAYAAFGKSHGNAFSNYSGTSLSCREPMSEGEKCEVNRLVRIAQPRFDYNENIGTKRTLTGIGYFVW